MIPVKLALRNFMSYTDVHEPLAFEGIQVACLTGDNGAGKSSLLDAITWALWGYSRAGSGLAQQLIHVGKTEMEVEFEFRLGGDLYRVVRKWTAPRSRGSGNTILDLAIQDGDLFRSVSGNTVRETEAKITDLLRMSYATFTNSAFLLQGKADAFTTRTPGDRKQVLADILELAEYDRFQQRAREEVASRESRRRELEDRLREADTELQGRAGYEAERDRLEAEIGGVEEQIARGEADVRRLNEDVTRLAGRERELSETEARVKRASQEVTRLQGQIREHERAIAVDRRILAGAADIERGAADLARARAADEALGRKLQELTPLAEERGRLDTAITRARTRLEGELKSTRQHLARVEADAARLADHERAVTAARNDRAELARIQARQAELAGQAAAAREQAAELRGANESLVREMKALRSRIETIQSAPICPICRSTLDPEARAKLTAEYTAEGKAQRAQHDENRVRAGELDGQIAQYETDLKRLDAEAGQLVGAERRLATAEAALDAARKAAREVEAAAGEVAKLDEQLARGAYAEAESARLREVASRIEALGYDQATHRRIRSEIAGLLEYEKLARDLAAARQAVTLREETLGQTRATLAAFEERLSEEHARIAALREEVRALPALRARFSSAERELAEMRRRHTAATAALGEARQRLSYLDRLQEQRAERVRELHEVMREKGLYTDLSTAFGKNGIQAMLIETAIPEIEDEANRLLSQMTEGRMHVTLTTQRARASGDGQIETLDIVINDLLGSRPYEMYSGGEAFRVNFALRIALSRLLARRAGARLQTLVIDEGFGSQDQAGRERLVEAIKSVETEFAMILIVTHLDDLKDRFPVRIDVQKGPSGSLLRTEWIA